MEKHKKDIENMLGIKNDIQSVESIIRKFLEAEFYNHKITRDEYIELIEFLNKKVKENDEKDRKKKQLDYREEIKEFHKKMNLDVTPIYKGEMGVVAPKRKNESEIDNNQEEER